MTLDTVISGSTLFLEKIKSFSEEFQNLPDALANKSLTDTWTAMATRLGVETHVLAEKIAASCGIGAELNLFQAEPELVTRVARNIAAEYHFIPVRKEGNAVIIAAANPFDPKVEEAAKFALNSEITLHIAPPDVIELAQAKFYSEQEGRKNAAALKSPAMEAGIPKLAGQLMHKAVEHRASDMHVQPFIGGATVRIRVDGLLKRMVLLPESVADALIRFFKAGSKMDPTNHRIPQDGRMNLEDGEHHYDLRVSTLPLGEQKEKLVIRFLNADATYSLDSTGLSLQSMHTLRSMASNPSGVVLLCGPTGSGKTTTLYSILAELNNEKTSITTIENPVEYRIAGLSQTEINEASGLTFAKALRSILRQDPDVILVGEIRDEETAQIAMQAALTGHLLFSTLHTNSALGAIPRLMDLGVQPVILSQALAGLVSQRLMRRLCPDCRERARKPLRQDEEIFQKITRVAPGYRAAGCESCGYTGYKGRVVISEMVEITPAIASLIAKGESDPALLLAAADEKIMTLAGDASRRIISGETTPAEGLRVMGKQFWHELATEYGTSVPDVSGIRQSSANAASKETHILLAGDNSAFSTELISTLEHAWLKLHFAATPEDANSELQHHTDIEFVILDLPDSLDDEAILDYVSDYRVAMAWSRLPALLLLPEGRPDLENKIREEGATSKMITKPENPEEVVFQINKAVAEHLDFRWGLSE